MKAKSCGAIVIYKGKESKFLLLKHRLGHWDFPKGLVEKGETEKETARREVEEETGLKIKIGKKINKVQYTYTFKKKLITKEVVFFLAESKNMKVTISPEHTAFTWAPYLKAMSLLPFKNQKETLKKANEK